VFVGGKSGPNARPGTKILEDVPCADLPDVLERLIPYMGKRAPSNTTTTSDMGASGSSTATAVEMNP